MTDAPPRDPASVLRWAFSLSQPGEDGYEPPADPDAGKDPAAIERGRAGGVIGGKARAERLDAEQRSEIAKKAAAARWTNRALRTILPARSLSTYT